MPGPSAIMFELGSHPCYKIQHSKIATLRGWLKNEEKLRGFVLTCDEQASMTWKEAQNCLRPYPWQGPLHMVCSECPKMEPLSAVSPASQGWEDPWNPARIFIYILSGKEGLAAQVPATPCNSLDEADGRGSVRRPWSSSSISNPAMRLP